MAYTVDNDSVKNLVWDSNPEGTSEATIIDGVLTELKIYNGDGLSLVLTTNAALLAHIKQVITDIENEIAAP